MVGNFFHIQPTRTMVVDLKEMTVKSDSYAKSMQIQSVRVSADLYSKYQSNNEA